MCSWNLCGIQFCSWKFQFNYWLPKLVDGSDLLFKWKIFTSVWKSYRLIVCLCFSFYLYQFLLFLYSKVFVLQFRDDEHYSDSYRASDDFLKEKSQNLCRLKFMFFTVWILISFNFSSFPLLKGRHIPL